MPIQFHVSLWTLRCCIPIHVWKFLWSCKLIWSVEALRYVSLLSRSNLFRSNTRGQNFPFIITWSIILINVTLDDFIGLFKMSHTCYVGGASIAGFFLCVVFSTHWAIGLCQHVLVLEISIALEKLGLLSWRNCAQFYRFGNTSNNLISCSNRTSSRHYLYRMLICHNTWVDGQRALLLGWRHCVQVSSKELFGWLLMLDGIHDYLLHIGKAYVLATCHPLIQLCFRPLMT